MQGNNPKILLDFNFFMQKRVYLNQLMGNVFFFVFENGGPEGTLHPFAQEKLGCWLRAGAGSDFLLPLPYWYLNTLNVTHSCIVICVKEIKHRLRDRFNIKHHYDAHMCSPLKC